MSRQRICTLADMVQTHKRIYEQVNDPSTKLVGISVFVFAPEEASQRPIKI